MSTLLSDPVSFIHMHVRDFEVLVRLYGQGVVCPFVAQLKFPRSIRIAPEFDTTASGLSGLPLSPIRAVLEVALNSEASFYVEALCFANFSCAVVVAITWPSGKTALMRIPFEAVEFCAGA